MKNNTFEMPVAIGGVVYDEDTPTFPQEVIGYRIGRMIGEEEWEYEEGYKPDTWYIQYERNGISVSSPVSQLGISFFLTREEAIKASKQN